MGYFMEVTLEFLKETEVFKKLVLSETAKGLIHAFFAQCTMSKVPGVTDIGLQSRNVRKAVVMRFLGSYSSIFDKRLTCFLLVNYLRFRIYVQTCWKLFGIGC